MSRRGFVDPDPLLTEKLEERFREIEARFPEPRSRADNRKLKRARRRASRESHLSRGAARWLRTNR
jgi:RNA processing factor Prp31